jgi:alpha-amylase/alpha-mannosidase (GH57 family)
MSKYICIHSHFYQPPRENPWLDKIQEQESAAPFHNWNERISNECYRENGRSRIKNERNYVEGVSNNYSKMNFNFGPTLLSWLEHHDPRTYDYIIKGDLMSVERYSGHGNAIAQCYNHMIMPLANKRDKETQIIWGIRDFEKRFNRYPEAMWLPETAVDIETLEILAEHKMKYVILAPRQAAKIHKLDTSDWVDVWIDVSSENINTKIPYLIKLPSGAQIAAFFYDGGLSKAVAFDGLLHNGEYFANRLLDGFTQEHGPQLVHIATDGESYGHHHRYGDMALTYAVKQIEDRDDVHLCNYGYFLKLYPPMFEVKIFENSSWSCAHGIERWKSDCGCNSGGRPEWNQKWRAPLRKTLNELRDDINEKFEHEVAKFNVDPWAVRNDFINVIVNRNENTNSEFIKKWIPHITNEAEQASFLKAFEIQRQLMFMFTSCAWFFDETSGIETVQVLQYALRAVEFAEDMWGSFVLDKFLHNLKTIPSNIDEYNSAYDIYEKILKNCQIGFVKIAAQYAMGSLFHEPAEVSSVYAFDVKKLDLEKIKNGSNKFVVGHAEFRSRITYSKRHIMFTAVHLGENNISAGVSLFNNNDEYINFKEGLVQKIVEGDFVSIMREIDRTFEKNVFTLNDLLHEDRLYLIKDILKEKMIVIDFRLQQIYDDNYVLVSFLNSLGIKLPNQLKLSFEQIVNEKMLNLFSSTIESLNTKQLTQLHNDAMKSHLQLKETEMRKVFLNKLIEFAEGIHGGFYNTQVLTNFLFAVRYAKDIVPNLHLSEVQFLIYKWREGFETVPSEFSSLAEEIFDALRLESRNK